MKKFKRLEILIESILQSIYNDVLENENTYISAETEITHNCEVVGTVKYILQKKVLEGSYWGWENSPENDEVEITLESSTVEMIYNSNSKELTNVTKLLNELLIQEDNKILNY